MLNYIKVELRKVPHRRGVYVLLALLLLCMALFLMLYSYDGFLSLAKGILVTMVVGMLVTPLLVQLADDGAAGTLKNELPFDLRRRMVYWEKLYAALLLGLTFCLVPVGGSLTGGRLFLLRGESGETLEGLALVESCPTGVLPTWCGVSIPCYMLTLVMRSLAAQTAGYCLMFFMGQPVLVFLTTLLFGVYEASAPFTLFTTVVLPCSLLTSALLDSQLTAQYQLWCWVISLGWMVANTGLGLFLFGRRSVR